MTPLLRRCAAPLSLAIAAGLMVSAPAQAAPTWLEPVNVDLVVANYPEQATVDVDALGAATAVWASYDDNFGDRTLRTSSHPVGGTWSAPVPLSDRLDEASFDLAVGAGGDAVVAWLVPGPTNDHVDAALRPAGGSWSAPITISADLVGSRRVHVGMDAAGNASAVWDANDGSDYVSSATAPRNGGWTAATPIDGSLGGSGSDLAVAPDGATTVVWDRYDADIDINTHVVEAVSRTSAGVAFGAAQIISDTDFAARSPIVAVSASGAAAAAWAQPTISDHSLLRAAIRPAGGTWAGSQPVSATPDATLELDESGAQEIVVDGTGAPTLAWTRLIDVDPGPVTNRQRSLYVAAATAGGSWSAPGLLGEYRNDDVSLGVDASGAATASWNAPGGSSNVVRRPAGGAWSAPMAVDPQAGVITAAVSTAVAPSGDVVAVWSAYDQAVQDADILRSRAYDVDGPLVSALSVPGSAAAGTPVAFSVTAVDAWSAVTSTSWSFGDGTTASGASVSHTYANAGTYAVSVTVTDAVGNARTRTGTTVVAAAPVVTPPAGPVTPKPKLTGVKLTEKTIHVKGSDDSPKATKLKIKLNTDAKVKVVLKRTKKVDGKTVKATVKKALKKGSSAIKLTSKVGSKKLPPGTYQVTVTAKNSVGTSVAVHLRLKIVA